MSQLPPTRQFLPHLKEIDLNKARMLSLVLGPLVLAACVPPPDEIQVPVAGSGGSAGAVVVGTGGSPATGGGSGGSTDGSTGGAFGTGGGSSSGGSRGSDAGVADAGVGDGGVSDGARVDATGSGGRNAGTGGTTVVAVCTSGRTWTGGNNSTMRPGANCKSCHGFSVAGTIYPTLHEPLNCNGVNGSTGVRVVITGANGQTVTLTPSSAGNFYTNTPVGASFTAKVTNGAATRAMLSPQTSGACNTCHTQDGANAAPGRIMAP